MQQTKKEKKNQNTLVFQKDLLIQETQFYFFNIAQTNICYCLMLYLKASSKDDFEK